MNPEKVGNFIKTLRKQNNLTQKDLADKYGVTYQAVSKWENGINLPEITLLRQMSKDFNVSLEDILDGEVFEKIKVKNTKKKIFFIILGIIIIMGIIFIVKINSKKPSFDFKTISTTCEEFDVSGSIAYDKAKSSIYISKINYCGGNDVTKYSEIECNLYEKNNDTSTKISSCKSETGNITLEEYLKEVELNIDNYTQTCQNYDNESLYLEINAKDKLGKITTYKVPLTLNKNC